MALHGSLRAVVIINKQRMNLRPADNIDVTSILMSQMGDNGNYQCYRCKQTKLRTPFICDNCGNLFHKSCLEENKTHKVIKNGEEITCSMIVDEIIVNESKDTDSVCSSDNTRKCKRKRGDKYDYDDEGISLYVDIILTKINEINFNQDELKKRISDQLMSLKNEIMKEIQKQIVSLRKEFSGLQSQKNVNIMVDSYAKKVENSKKENIIVEPKIQQNSDETFKQVTSKIEVGKMGLRVDNVKKTQNGKLIISCDSKNVKSVLAEKLKNKIGKNYNIKMPSKKLLKIKIIDVMKEIMDIEENEEIIEMIKRQNDIGKIDNTKVDIIKKIKNKNKSGMVIIEVDPKTHKALLEKQKINLGWNKCRVYDHINVLRCYKCYGYHHLAKECKNETICRKCAGNHIEKDFINNSKKCVNCTRMVEEFKLKGIKTDHYANDESCECYKRMVTRAQKNIQYYEE